MLDGQFCRHRGSQRFSEVHESSAIDVRAAQEVRTCGACIMLQPVLARSACISPETAVIEEQHRQIRPRERVGERSAKGTIPRVSVEYDDGKRRCVRSRDKPPGQGESIRRRKRDGRRSFEAYSVWIWYTPEREIDQSALLGP